ncbi:MAG: hypothetical protein D6B25_16895 [Desulfobulbaceae bacterium]|nr:MAG: hypothetical protein D6B25_16895 [Desulfobulbaceae bacterium]
METQAILHFGSERYRGFWRLFMRKRQPLLSKYHSAITGKRRQATIYLTEVPRNPVRTTNDQPARTEKIATSILLDP